MQLYPMKPIRIKPELLSLLTSLGADSFTTSELTKAYLSILGCESLSLQAVNQFMRRNIKRLENRGMVKRTSAAGSSPIMFKLTESFKEGNYETGSPHRSPCNEIVNENSQFKSELRNRRHKYKIELLTTMGEVEEYDFISNQAPIQQALMRLVTLTGKCCKSGPYTASTDTRFI